MPKPTLVQVLLKRPAQYYSVDTTTYYEPPESSGLSSTPSIRRANSTRSPSIRSVRSTRSASARTSTVDATSTPPSSLFSAPSRSRSISAGPTSTVGGGESSPPSSVISSSSRVSRTWSSGEGSKAALDILDERKKSRKEFKKLSKNWTTWGDNNGSILSDRGKDARSRRLQPLEEGDGSQLSAAGSSGSGSSAKGGRVEIPTHPMAVETLPAVMPNPSDPPIQMSSAPPNIVTIPPTPPYLINHDPMLLANIKPPETSTDPYVPSSPLSNVNVTQHQVRDPAPPLVSAIPINTVEAAPSLTNAPPHQDSSPVLDQTPPVAETQIPQAPALPPQAEPAPVPSQDHFLPPLPAFDLLVPSDRETIDQAELTSHRPVLTRSQPPSPSVSDKDQADSSTIHAANHVVPIAQQEVPKRQSSEEDSPVPAVVPVPETIQEPFTPPQTWETAPATPMEATIAQYPSLPIPVHPAPVYGLTEVVAAGLAQPLDSSGDEPLEEKVTERTSLEFGEEQPEVQPSYEEAVKDEKPATVGSEASQVLETHEEEKEVSPAKIDQVVPSNLDESDSREDAQVVAQDSDLPPSESISVVPVEPVSVGATENHLPSPTADQPTSPSIEVPISQPSGVDSSESSSEPNPSPEALAAPALIAAEPSPLEPTERRQDEVPPSVDGTHSAPRSLSDEANESASTTDLNVVDSGDHGISTFVIPSPPSVEAVATTTYADEHKADAFDALPEETARPSRETTQGATHVPLEVSADQPGLLAEGPCSAPTSAYVAPQLDAPIAEPLTGPSAIPVPRPIPILPRIESVDLNLSDLPTSRVYGSASNHPDPTPAVGVTDVFPVSVAKPTDFEEDHTFTSPVAPPRQTATLPKDQASEVEEEEDDSDSSVDEREEVSLPTSIIAGSSGPDRSGTLDSSVTSQLSPTPVEEVVRRESLPRGSLEKYMTPFPNADFLNAPPPPSVPSFDQTPSPPDSRRQSRSLARPHRQRASLSSPSSSVTPSEVSSVVAPLNQFPTISRARSVISSVSDGGQSMYPMSTLSVPNAAYHAPRQAPYVVQDIKTSGGGTMLALQVQNHASASLGRSFLPPMLRRRKSIKNDLPRHLIGKFSTGPNVQFTNLAKKPKKLRSYEVLVRVFSVALDFGDRQMATEMAGRSDGFGYIPGRSFVGKVVDCGCDADRVKRGDFVYGLADIKRSGACAEFVTIDHNLVAHAPIGRLSLEQIAALPLHGVTAYLALKMLCPPLPTGSKILILNAHEGIGALACQLASSFYADHGFWVTGHCPEHSPDAELFCRAHGASEVLRGDVMSIINSLRESSYDAVVDTVGGRELYDASRRILHHSGAFCTMVGDEVDVPGVVPTASMNWKNGVRSLRRAFVKKDHKSIEYWNMRMEMWQKEDTREALEMIGKEARLGEVRPVVGVVYPLDDGGQAFRRDWEAREAIIVRVMES